MALTRILGLSNSPSLHHCCRRTFATALNHTRVVYPNTINRDSKTCSKRLIGPFLRNFCTSPVVSDDMQRSVTEDLIYSVKSLRTDVEILRTEVSLLSEVVRTIQKDKTVSSFGSYSSEEIWDSDSEGNKEKVTEKKSDFSQAIATDHLNTNIVSSTQDNKAADKTSDLSEAMTTHFNTKIVISQDKKAAEKMSDFSEEIRTSYSRDNNEKLAAEKMSDFSEEIQKSDTVGNNEKATEKLSNFSEAMASQDTEIQKCDSEEGNNETVPDGKEQDPLLKEIQSEISRAVDFSRVSSQGRIFPDDFPLKVYYDMSGVTSITLYGENKLEEICVTVNPPSIFTSITAENYHYYKSSKFMMKLRVQVFPVNPGGIDIVFDCSAYSTGFLIEKVYGPHDHYKKGLDFSELNDDLQKEFKKFLEIRGIKTSTTNIIFGYMLDKVNREKLRSLYKLQELVEA